MSGMILIATILFITSVAGGLLWAHRSDPRRGAVEGQDSGQSARQSEPSSVSSPASVPPGGGSGLAGFWTILGIIGALGSCIIALAEFASGQTLFGAVSLFIAPFIALGPMTIAYAIRWSMRVEAMLMPKAG